MAINATSLPFKEQAEFLRRKINLPTESWTDIYNAQHDWAFVVAGANRDAIVSSFREAIERVVNEGATLEQFRKDFDSIVTKTGWSYNGGRNWRSRVIYETNLNSSYQAGRYEQLMEVRNERPYWRYIHNDSVEHPRPLHVSWNGLILRWDNPWWKTHFPVNAWGCHCRVESLSERDMKRLGLTESEAPQTNYEERTIGQRSPGGPRVVRVPEGIDPGFEYTPGQSRLHAAVLTEKPTPDIPGSAGGPGLPNTRPADELPPPRKMPASSLLPSNLTEEQYADAFLKRFGATLDEPAIFRDVIGEALVVGKEMFTTSRTGELKANKNGRGQYMNLLAEALKAPDEVWVRMEWHFAQKKAVVRRRYISRITLPDSDVPALAVFEYGADGWSGVTTFANEFGDINDLRVGVRLYKRGK